jgi:hypothetical protein
MQNNMLTAPNLGRKPSLMRASVQLGARRAGQEAVGIAETGLTRKTAHVIKDDAGSAREP